MQQLAHKELGRQAVSHDGHHVLVLLELGVSEQRCIVIGLVIKRILTPIPNLFLSRDGCVVGRLDSNLRVVAQSVDIGLDDDIVVVVLLRYWIIFNILL